MTFGWSSSVTLLFDFWDVHGPAGMVLSVFVVLLLTVFYEVLKSAYAPPPYRSDSTAALESSPSESSLTPMEPPPPAANTTQVRVLKWLLHAIQTALHMLQVSLGYMLMLCVMSYNTWIFLGVVVGSVLGYFISFPLVVHK
ncbi:hypothetical protein F7725_015307 [Dissostichus mawsoni]|uniref:Copper transport protein n=1 Tax=Dissostichus mawsoni TaxID=36200 RepID=A0A7J5YHF0_DISMA|nr:hypothetical protein F7725_015307 [Dissostichus mawsoni]